MTYAKCIIVSIVAFVIGAVGTGFYFDGQLRFRDADIRATGKLNEEYLEIIGRANTKIDDATNGLKAISNGIAGCQIIIGTSSNEVRSATETLRKIIDDRKEFRKRLEILQTACNNYLIGLGGSDNL